MENPTKNLSIAAILLFIFGLLAGMALWAANVWADLEASLFDPAIAADAVINDLRCPQFITPSEYGVVSIRLHNPTDRVIRQGIRTHISYGFVTYMRQENHLLELQPREIRQMEWIVSPEDAAWGRLILVRLHLFRSFPLPSRTATCGIIVLDLPMVSGSQVTWLMLGLSLAGTLGGWQLLRRASQRLQSNRSSISSLMSAWIVILAIGNALALSGLWIPAGVLFLLSIIFLLLSIAYSLQST
ncbi:MAG: hypothetical protein ROW48_12700 [Bellilinea sp.]|jgi:hypothetical protein